MRKGRKGEGVRERMRRDAARKRAVLFHRAAYDAGAFVTIRTGGLTGDTCVAA